MDMHVCLHEQETGFWEFFLTKSKLSLSCHDNITRTYSQSLILVDLIEGIIKEFCLILLKMHEPFILFNQDFF